MRTATPETRTALEEARVWSFADSVEASQPESLRSMADRLNMPPGLTASLSRIARGEEGVSLEKENEVRAYIGLSPITQSYIIYNAATHKLISRTPTRKRKPRASTSFDPQVFDNFRKHRDKMGLSNDAFLDNLLGVFEHATGDSNV